MLLLPGYLSGGYLLSRVFGAVGKLFEFAN